MIPRLFVADRYDMLNYSKIYNTLSHQNEAWG